MAIQEVEKREVQGTAGKRRKINAAAEGMVMDIVQAQQYQKPIASTVRELTANAVDSQSEKERAIEILSGSAKASDYFIERDGALYADSKWDPTYYDRNHLNQDKNAVEIIYRSGEGGGRCDSFIVRDYGVGIGSSRLEGVLEIGYSTKRNRKDALGAFGLGAKVGLATSDGTGFYILTTVYNGVKYKIQVFNRKINSMIGALDLNKGEANVPYTFSDGFVIHGERTDEKNYTEVEVPALKHHKTNYIEAVKTQLLYFRNVKFYQEDTDGYKDEISFKADTMYNSANLIISKNSPYSKPHIVIVKGGDNVESQTGVCYGHIDFKEMELEDLHGDIGVKCPIRQVMEDDEGNEVLISDGVDVVPSRETVRWTAATRVFLKKQFEIAQEEATSLVEKELQQTDFVKWLNACKNIVSYSGGNNAIGRLSRIVDLQNVQPKFKGTKIRFGIPTSVFKHCSIVKNTKFKDKEGLYQVNRDDKNIGWNLINTDTVYFKTSQATRHRDVYCADQSSGNTFITISPKLDEVIENAASVMVTKNKLQFQNKAAWIKKAKADRDEVINLLKSSESYKSYDELVVPEEYIKNLTKIEQGKVDEEGNSLEVEVKLSPKEQRELEMRVVCKTFVERYIPFHKEDTTDKTYQMSKREPKFQEIKDYKGTLYYGFKQDESKLQYACHILDRMNEVLCADVNKACIDERKLQPYRSSDRFDNEFYKVLAVSRGNKKHFSMHKHIDDFFGEAVLVKNEKGQVTGCDVIMDNAIVHWNTARKIDNVLKSLGFLENFANFNQKAHEDYILLKEYVARYNKNLKTYRGRFAMDQHHEDFLRYLNHIEKLQMMSESDETPETIADYVKEASLPTGITGGLAVNRDLLNMADALIAYAKPVAPVFNMMELLVNSSRLHIDMATTLLIQEIIDWKKLEYGHAEEIQDVEDISVESGEGSN